MAVSSSHVAGRGFVFLPAHQAGRSIAGAVDVPLWARVASDRADDAHGQAFEREYIALGVDPDILVGRVFRL